MSISGDFNSIIPIAALYAFAGYRLMPALQQIYGAISQLRFVRPSLDALKMTLRDYQVTLQIIIKKFKF